jgi:hypothetical protein
MDNIKTENETKVKEKNSEQVKEGFPKMDDEFLSKVKEAADIKNDEENLTDEALHLITYKRYLGIRVDDKDELSNLQKIDKLLTEQGLNRQKNKAMVIKEVQYKLGGKPSLSRVYQYLKIESQIKSLVERLKNV